MKKELVIITIIMLIFTVGCKAIENTNTSNINIKNDSYTKENLNNTNDTQNKIQASSEDIEVINTVADFMVSYDSVDSLVNNADMIIEGEVIEVESLNHNVGDTSVVYTKSKIKVTNSYLGDTKIGDIVTFVEPGGMTTKKSLGLDKKFKDMSKEELDSKIQILFDGVPNMKLKDEVILFGANSELDVLEEDYFDLIGAHQGKFKVSDGMAKRFTKASDVSVHASENIHDELTFNRMELNEAIKNFKQ